MRELDLPSLSPEDLELVRCSRIYEEMKQHFREKRQRVDMFFEEEDQRVKQGDIDTFAYRQRAKEFRESERRQTNEFFKQKFGWDDFEV